MDLNRRQSHGILEDARENLPTLQPADQTAFEKD
jgi:hypothetical protein